MEQGCPHRSILPHIFPDCNSFAIKIGGKFCGVRGVCPGGAACLGVAGAAGVSGTRRGAYLLCRLPTLPLWCPRGGVPALSPVNPALTCFPAPIPRPPSRREGGDYRLFYARGFAPCIPGAEPARHRFALPLWKTQWGRAPALPARQASAIPGGGLPALPPANPAFSLLFRPSPRPPSRREGGDFLLSYARGFAPCIPGAEPARHWFALPLWKTQWGLAPALPARRASAVPGGGACPGVAGAAGVSGTRRGACLLCRLLTLP